MTPPAWSAPRLEAMIALADDMGVAPDASPLRWRRYGQRVIVHVTDHPDASPLEGETRVTMREDDDEATRQTQMATIGEGLAAWLRGVCNQLDPLPPERRHAHLVVARALDALVQGDHVPAAGIPRCQLDGRDNAWTHAGFDIGRAAFHQRWRDVHLLIPMGVPLPDTVVAAMPGRLVSEIVQHPWLDHPQLLVTRAFGLPGQGRLRLALSFVHARAKGTQHG